MDLDERRTTTTLDDDDGNKSLQLLQVGAHLVVITASRKSPVRLSFYSNSTGIVPEKASFDTVLKGTSIEFQKLGVF